LWRAFPFCGRFADGRFGYAVEFVHAAGFAFGAALFKGGGMDAAQFFLRQLFEHGLALLVTLF
jgi:hypothetical protein